MARTPDPLLISQAIVIWTGWRETPWPARNEARLVSRCGSDDAAALLPFLTVLVDEFYSSTARLTVADLTEMGDAAADEFRTSHPELTEEAVQALTWCYTFDNK